MQKFCPLCKISSEFIEFKARKKYTLDANNAHRRICSMPLILVIKAMSYLPGMTRVNNDR